MAEKVYGIELLGRRGNNELFFKNLNDRKTFLNLMNRGRFTGRITLIEVVTNNKQEEK